MLENSKLLIDEDCPLCTAYGAGFTYFKLIDPETICPYQRAQEAVVQHIDTERACHEIALYDATTQSTRYGIDAMIGIVAHQKLWLQTLLHHPVCYRPLRQLYRFISYNRKVIYPGAPQPGAPQPEAAPEVRSCNPPLHRTYRWLYILLVALFTGVVLNRFAYLVNTGWEMAHNPWREYFVCFGQVVWQGAAVWLISKERVHEYLGNMSTVSLVGALLLLPLLLTASVTTLSPWVLLGYFSLVVGGMLLEHLRRCRLLGLPLVMSASWVAFRTVVLLIILSTIFL